MVTWQQNVCCGVPQAASHAPSRRVGRLASTRFWVCPDAKEGMTEELSLSLSCSYPSHWKAAPSPPPRLPPFFHKYASLRHVHHHLLVHIISIFFFFNQLTLRSSLYSSVRVLLSFSFLSDLCSRYRRFVHSFFWISGWSPWTSLGRPRKTLLFLKVCIPFFRFLIFSMLN